ncbi:PI-PLC X domain-containing protein [Vitis vinifera]|uniref:PI-PLC X domain-containing protein n=1 Tax=Vitis vinifera TaxID=29760 RepID=A0A438EQ48_VITVI|nr:PI-PLC X domain-containing protein [Vitis vinifera]
MFCGASIADTTPHPSQDGFISTLFIAAFLLDSAFALKLGQTCVSDGNCDSGLHCETCLANGNVRPRCTRTRPVNPTSKVKGLPFNRYSWLTTHNAFAKLGRKPDNLETVLDLEGNVEIFSNFGILACQEALVSYEPHLEFKIPSPCLFFFILLKTRTVWPSNKRREGPHKMRACKGPIPCKFDASDWFFPLQNGVRGLMLDMYDFDNDIWLCHSYGGQCYNYTAFQPAINVLKEVQVFLEANPSEIVTIIIEDYVTSPKGLTNVFNAAGLRKFWFPVSRMPRNGGDWPTVEDMVEKNQRWWFLPQKQLSRLLKGLLMSGDT